MLACAQVGVVVCIVAIPLIATEHQSAEWVFTHFSSELAESYGINNKVRPSAVRRTLLLPLAAPRRPHVCGWVRHGSG